MSKRIYTRTGDKGETGLLSGERIDKDSHRVEAYGTVDELISVLGLAKVHTSERIAGHIHSIQQVLFYIAAELATNMHHIDSVNDWRKDLKRAGEQDVTELENLADELSEELPQLSNFVIPGGTRGAAFLHQARTVCRRAERRVIAFSRLEQVNGEIIRYLNRLSDLLFVMARYENLQAGDGDYLISRNGVQQ
ncbi:MAG: cob(I)yrinic acid a,c-diamide adenosyltransferase [Candidatus Thorarchaeota archaeon]|nr:cob(I)yrinic acid a,c-diamide adenosyltransferase [Candidatus Thorarchaeota archaeon]